MFPIDEKKNYIYANYNINRSREARDPLYEIEIIKEKSKVHLINYRQLSQRIY